MNKDLTHNVGTLCFWSWNAKLDIDEICYQLQDFARGHYSGVVIHARAGLEDAYMGKEWFRAYRVALEEAARLGLDVWIYDEDGWPSGFAGGVVPELGEEHCLKKLKTCKGKPETGRILAVYRKSESENTYIRIEEDELAENDLVFYIEISEHYVDLMSERTVAEFIRSTHERYRAEFSEYFGTTIKGMFTDEPQLNVDGYPWSDTLEEAYEECYHENLLDSLYLLSEQAEGHEKFRYQFFRLLSERLYHSFTKQIADWCEANHLQMTGHFGTEDGLTGQITGNAGVMRQYAAMQTPGIDHLGNRITSPVLEKQLSSVAHQLGKENTLSETFGCCGWDVSFQQLAWIWGRQSALGVTTPCFHLAPLSIHGRRKRDYPAFFSYHELWWEPFTAYVKWMDTLNDRMCEGERLVDVLVISPLYGVMAEFTSWCERKKRMEYYSAQYRILLENLLDAQIDFELGDEAILKESGVVENGMLRVGRASYHVVLVSPTMTLTKEVCELLDEFARTGGRIFYVNERPEMIDMQPVKDVLPHPIAILQNRRGMIDKWIRAERIRRLVSVVSESSRHILPGTVIHTRKLDAGYRTHIWTDEYFNGGEAVVLLDGDFSVAWYDLHTGQEHILPTEHEAGKTLARLPMTAKGNYMLELQRNDIHTEDSWQVITSRKLSLPEPRLCHANCFTIDYAKMSVNGADYSELLPVTSMVDDIYQKRRDEEMTLDLQYTFHCEKGFVPKNLSAVVEEEYMVAVQVNGIDVIHNRTGWWLDKCMGEYEIAKYVTDGENIITLTYQIPHMSRNLAEDGNFETARNRFFYPVEPESIYLRGDFDVDSGAEIGYNGKTYMLHHTTFQLVRPTTKKVGELTCQGLWFYRGNVEYVFKIQKSEKYRQVLQLKTVEAPCVEWQIGEHTGVQFSADGRIDLTDYLKTGENKVVIRLIGSNRNLLGPHHHKLGTCKLVGPSTFLGTYGWEDFVNQEIPFGEQTWTDDYSFVRFGLKDVYLVEHEKR